MSNFFEANEIENVVAKWTVILSRPQCVNLQKTSRISSLGKSFGVSIFEYF